MAGSCWKRGRWTAKVDKEHGIVHLMTLRDLCVEGVHSRVALEFWHARAKLSQAAVQGFELSVVNFERLRLAWSPFASSNDRLMKVTASPGAEYIVCPDGRYCAYRSNNTPIGFGFSLLEAGGKTAESVTSRIVRNVINGSKALTFEISGPGRENNRLRICIDVKGQAQKFEKFFLSRRE